MYAAADRMLGRLVKVTPSSKVVGDLALHLVGAGVDADGLRGRPRPVRHARLGDRLPARRAGRPARRLAGAVPHPGAGGPRRAEAESPELSDDDRAGPGEDRRATLNRLLFPGPTKEFDGPPRGVRRHLACWPRKDFFYGLRARATSTPSTLEPGVHAADRAGGDLARPTSAACAP